MLQFPMKMLEHNEMILWKDFGTCPTCKLEFTCFNKMSRIQSRRPYVLHNCGHLICEDCLKVKVECCSRRHNNEFTCDQCNGPVKFNRSKYWRDDFHLSYFVLGSLIDRNRRLQYGNSSLSNSSADSTLYSSKLKHKNEIEAQNCYECCNASTDKHCLQCAVPYCQRCFDSVHSIGKSLKTHQFVLLSKKRCADVNICIKHQESKIFLCVDCKISICNMCFLGHKGHKILNIKSENEKLQPDITKMLCLLQEASTSCQAAGHAMNTALNVYKRYTETTISELSQHYHYMHSVLQQFEEKHLQYIKDRAQPLIDSGAQIHNNFKVNFEQLTEKINMFRQYERNLPDTVNMEEVLNQTVKWMRHLIVQVEFDGVLNDNPFILKTEESFAADLSAYVDLQCKETFKFELQEFPIDKLLNISCSEPLKYSESKAVLHSGGNRHNGSSARKSKVYISHISNPEKIYVQTKEYHDSFQHNCQRYESLARCNPIPSNVVANNIYLVCDNDKWYRGKMIRKDYESYNFFLIDHGHTKLIQPNNIRVISTEEINRKNGASPCSLFNLVSKSGTWPEEANQLLLDIVGREEVTMFIMDYNTNPWQVELISYVGGLPTFLRDALLFAGFGEYSDAQYKTNASKELEIYKKCLLDKSNQSIDNSNEPLIAGATIPVKVISIKSPGEFYCRHTEYVTDFDQLLGSFEQYYSDTDKKKYMFLMPRKGNICAVLDCKEKWNRAVVMNVTAGYCEVRFIDIGTTEKVPWHKIFKLENAFLFSDTLVRCQLSDVKPKQENNYEWSIDTCDFFKKTTSTESTTCKILINALQGRIADVKLSLVKLNCEVNLNALLVKYNYVVSTGLTSREEELTKYYENNKKNDLIVPNTNLDKNNLRKSNRRVEVVMQFVSTPGEFYVIIEKYTRGICELEKKIQTEMNKCDSKAPNKIWKIDEYCVVFANLKAYTGHDQYRWFRATIREMLNDNKYRVFLRDKGYVIDILKDSIHDISQDMKVLMDGVMKCELACVKPTGGHTNWSHIAVDKFKVIVEHFPNMAISLDGNYKKENGTFPVILWGVIEVTENAFAPSTRKYININKYMVNEGFLHLTKPFDKYFEDFDALEKALLADFDKRFTEWFKTINAIEIVQNPDGAGIQLVEKEIDTANEVIDDAEIERQLENIRCTKLQNWLLPKKNRKITFECIPTYVDNNVVIYLHEAKHKEILQRLNVSINERVLTNNYNKYYKFKHDQPCLVRFYADNKYYRGKVTDVLNNSTYKVQFVDYGNIELVNVSDMKVQLIATNVPILATKYRLSDVSPIFASGWPIQAIDCLHSLIVNKVCELRVDVNYVFMNTDDDEEVIPCRLTLRDTNQDVSQLLVEQNLFIYNNSNNKKEQKANNKIDVNWDPFDEFIKPIVSDQTQGTSKTYINYRAMFNEMNKKAAEAEAEADEEKDEFDLDDTENDDFLNKLRKSIVSTSDRQNGAATNCFEENSSNNLDYDNELGSVTTEEIVNESVGESELEKSVTFEPYEFDTSSQVTSMFDLSHENDYNILKVHRINGFYATIEEMVSPIYFCIAPKIIEHTQKLEEIDKYIQDNIVFTIPLDCYDNVPCLAYYDKLKKWCRAIVKKYDVAVKKCEVLFVDYNVKTTLIPKFLKGYGEEWHHILQYPLRMLTVKLHNIKVNKAKLTSSTTVMNEFMQRWKAEEVYVKILKASSIPEIELYADNSCEVRVYQDLIDNQFFIKV